MSLYLRLFTSFFTHRKTLRLRQAIGDAAYWVPPRLWAYAVEHNPDGSFGKFGDKEIAEAIGYSGDAAKLVKALTDAGFLDSRKRVKNWAEHNEYHAAFSKRAKHAADCRWSRDRKRQDRTGKTRRKESETKGKEQAMLEHAPSMLGFCTTAEAVPASDNDLFLSELKADKAYEGIDVEAEHAKMLRWCKENRKQPTRRRFINWLNRADKPLNGQPAPGRLPNKAPAWVQIKALKEALSTHPANPDYAGYFPERVTTEMQKDYNEKAIRLAELTEQSCNGEALE